MRLPFRRRMPEEVGSYSEQIQRGGWSGPLPWETYQSFFTYNSQLYPFGVQTTMRGDKEEILPDFPGLSAQAYGANPVVFACTSLRMDVFSEARIQFQEIRKGRPGQLFGDQSLSLIEQPGGANSSQTTADLMARALQDVDLAGNWFGVRDGDRIRRLRPDWVTIVLGSRSASDRSEVNLAWDAETIGYIYHPGGSLDPDKGRVFDVSEVAHFIDRPDPLALFRGMSWITPVIREVIADKQATSHKLKFFEQGATSNAVVKAPDNMRREMFDEWVEKFTKGHEGVNNAYKTIYLGGGFDMNVVGANFQQMDFKIVQGAGETRIAAAARTHPVVVGLSEGLQGSSLNAGNYQAARRSFADGTMRPLWRKFVGSLAQILPPPNSGARLWYDARDVAFLHEDAKDEADIRLVNAQTLAALVRDGWEPDAAVDYISSDDIASLAGAHSGLPSIQLQPPPAAIPQANGSAPTSASPLPAP